MTEISVEETEEEAESQRIQMQFDTQQHKMQCSQCGVIWYTAVNHPPGIGTYEPCPECWSNHGSYHCDAFAEENKNQCSLCNVNLRVSALKESMKSHQRRSHNDKA